ncbi:MAG: hypothetical protein K2I07_13060 [Lachnospiraceae bacterium]|nr:hypothetical protein [Lachnospiraceae bacterium]
MRCGTTENAGESERYAGTSACRNIGRAERLRLAMCGTGRKETVKHE